MFDQVNLSFSTQQNSSDLSQLDVSKVENALVKQLIVNVAAAGRANPSVFHGFNDVSV